MMATKIKVCSRKSKKGIHVDLQHNGNKEKVCSRKSKKDIHVDLQHNGNKDKRTSNDLQNITQK
jgi:hypothetical protein